MLTTSFVLAPGFQGYNRKFLFYKLTLPDLAQKERFLGQKREVRLCLVVQGCIAGCHHDQLAAFRLSTQMRSTTKKDKNEKRTGRLLPETGASRYRPPIVSAAADSLWLVPASTVDISTTLLPCFIKLIQN